MIKKFISIRVICLIIYTLAFFSVHRLVQAALVIEPALIELKLDQNRNSGTFLIRNVGDKDERYRATSVHFVITKEGALREIPPDEYSLAEWIKFNPKEFVLPPKTSRMVRFSIIPRGKIQQRMYRGAIEFMPLKGAEVKTHDGKGRSFNLHVLSVVLVPIYGYVEDIQNSGKITDIYVKGEREKQQIYGCVANTGDGMLQLRGSCRIFDAAGKKLVEEVPVKLLVIYPKTERLARIKCSKPLPAGRYRVNFTFSSADPKYKVDLSKESDIKVSN